MIRTGVILAGGTGSRIQPLTFSTSKHLLPIFDKPVIFYSLSILMLMKIKNILIICNKNDKKNFKSLLGDGLNFGVTIKYALQDKPNGIPEAINISKGFTKNQSFVLMLGDNFLYGNGLSTVLLNISKNFNEGCNIFTYTVKDPEKYGVISLGKDNKYEIYEKPKKPKSNKAIIGLYFFDNKANKYYLDIKPSSRGETEIVDILKKYNNEKSLKSHHFERGFAWMDTGTYSDLLEASNFVRFIEGRQNLKIACLEEIALNNKWITKAEIKKNINKRQSPYYQYLRNVIS